MSQLLDISIGPVQSFVGKSRRTRDLWGSSYLLSFLAAHAAAGADAAGGKVHVVDSPLYRAARQDGDGGAPRIGTVPNHFQVTVDGDPREVAAAAQRRLDDAWQRVCDAVWRRYVEPVAGHGDQSTAIWDRQVGTFWQLTWVAGAEDVRGLLRRRKLWHDTCPPEEPGDRCSVMPTLQELSGHIRTHGHRARSAQQEFWERLRERGRVGPLELREEERLSAVALVKRLFANEAEAALGWSMDVGNWPSTVWVGALPWLHTVQAAAPDVADRYAQAVTRGVDGATRPLPAHLATLAPVGELARVDANYLHRGFIADPGRCPLPKGSGPARERQARADLRAQLDTLHRTSTGTGQRPSVAGGPPVYYAVLRADGDKLGDLATDRAGRDLVGRALDEFASGRAGAAGVDALIGEYGGLPIYVGGDDVLAMLPVESALACAAALAQRYRAAFARLGAAHASLSAGVLFAHVRLPLATALTDSKRLLEEVAKEGNDRNSLAVGVLKPGSRHCEWVTRWQRSGPDGQPAEAVDQITGLAGALSADGTEPGLSTSVLYRVRDTVSRLCGWPRWEPGQWRPLAAGVDAPAYLRAEIRHSLAGQPGQPGRAGRDDADSDRRLREQADSIAMSVWSLLRDDAEPGSERVGLDALVLARFLAHGGHEEEHS